jgi:hypothetical protein
VSERGRLTALFVSLAVLVGVLSWLVLASDGDGILTGSRCFFAITNNDGIGCEEVPCG